MDRLTHRDIQELLGVYALDAVDDDERELVELHLPDCPRCRAEVAEHRDVAAFLGNSTAPAPDGVWSRIASSLEEAPPPLTLVPSRTPRLSTRRAVRVATALAAAAAVLVGVVAVRTLDDRGPDAVLEDWVAHSARLAEDSPDARTLVLASPDGSVHAKAVVLRDGTGFFVGDALPELPAGRTYQLWAIVGDKTISAGILGRDPRVVPFTVAADTKGYAVTDEAEGGVVSSTRDPVLVGLRA